MIGSHEPDGTEVISPFFCQDYCYIQLWRGRFPSKSFSLLVLALGAGFYLPTLGWLDAVIYKILEDFFLFLKHLSPVKIKANYRVDGIHAIWPNRRIFFHGVVSYESYLKGFEKLLGTPSI